MRIYVGICIVVVIWLLFYFNRQSQSDHSNGTVTTEVTGSEEVHEEEAVPHVVGGIPEDTRIDFWGRVIDESGRGVQDVKVKAYALDTPFPLNGEGSNYALSTDKEGGFSLTGIKGASLGVHVSKEGYAPVIDSLGRSSSNRTIPYFRAADYLDNDLPTKSLPTTFLLRKRNTPTSVLLIKKSRYKLTSDGNPLHVKIGNDASMIIRCWADLDKRYGSRRNSPYDWRYEVNIERASFIEDSDRNSRIAPDAAYRSNLTLEMKGDSPSWRSNVNGNYWVKYDDGTYGWVSFEVLTGRKFGCYIEGIRNPNVGEKTLDVDYASLRKSAIRIP